MSLAVFIEHNLKNKKENNMKRIVEVKTFRIKKNKVIYIITKDSKSQRKN